MTFHTEYTRPLTSGNLHVCLSVCVCVCDSPVPHADRYKVLISHRMPANSTDTCGSSRNTSWSAWTAYQFPLRDYPGKGAGAGEASSDALFGVSEALLFAPAAGWTGGSSVFLACFSSCLLCAFASCLLCTVYMPNLMLNPALNPKPCVKP